MKKVTMTLVGYEAPQATMIQLVPEQAVLAGSSSSILDDMYETNGEWAD